MPYTWSADTADAHSSIRKVCLEYLHHWWRIAYYQKLVERSDFKGPRHPFFTLTATDGPHQYQSHLWSLRSTRSYGDNLIFLCRSYKVMSKACLLFHHHQLLLAVSTCWNISWILLPWLHSGFIDSPGCYHCCMMNLWELITTMPRNLEARLQACWEFGMDDRADELHFEQGCALDISLIILFSTIMSVKQAWKRNGAILVIKIRLLLLPCLLWFQALTNISVKIFFLFSGSNISITKLPWESNLQKLSYNGSIENITVITKYTYIQLLLLMSYLHLCGWSPKVFPLGTHICFVF